MKFELKDALSVLKREIVDYVIFEQSKQPSVTTKHEDISHFSHGKEGGS